MPQRAVQENYRRSYGYPQTYSYVDVPERRLKPVQNPIHHQTPRKRIQDARKPKKKKNLLASLISLSFMFLIGYYVLPFAFHRISLPLLTARQNYSNIKANYYDLMFPTSKYIHNTIFEGRHALAGVSTKKPLMTDLYKTDRLTILEDGLKELMKKYPTIQPAITVWDFNTGKYVDINGSEIYPAASIIKVPVLINLFKTIEANGLSIYDEMTLTNYYKASGSGNLQYAASGRNYTIDKLAKTMIEDSDNSATNMLMSKLGSMTAVNTAIRSWGTTMLFNLDNPNFLSINSREYIVDYMSHVKNDRLIPQGLGKGATFLHKTGDIGTMLGDAGIVYMPNGKKYIVVIMAKRPYNSPLGKQFIQQASKLIYEGMLNTY